MSTTFPVLIKVKLSLSVGLEHSVPAALFWFLCQQRYSLGIASTIETSNMQFYNPNGGAPVNPTSQSQGYYGGNTNASNAGAQGNGNVPNMFNNVSPEMINFGLNAGQNMLNQQRDKWMPGVSGFWHSLKYYFLVSTTQQMWRVHSRVILMFHPSLRFPLR